MSRACLGKLNRCTHVTRVSAAAKCFVAVSQFSVSHLDLLPLREPGPWVALDADQGPTHTYSESHYVKKQETRFFKFFLLSSSRACLGKLVTIKGTIVEQQQPTKTTKTIKTRRRPFRAAPASRRIPCRASTAYRGSCFFFFLGLASTKSSTAQSSALPSGNCTLRSSVSPDSASPAVA